MKKILMVMVMLLGVTALGASTMSLATARAGIAEALESPKTLTQTMKQLSPADQVAYVASVMTAISAMPGSGETRAAAFLTAGRAAILGAAKGNMTAVLAEIYATVPTECLTVINEAFSREFFNRAASSSKTYTDAQFTKIAEDVVSKVVTRCAQVENAGVREGFAVLMFLRASNLPMGGTEMTALVDALVAKIDKESQQIAKSEWFPAAMGASAETKSYSPMLGAANVGEAPDVDKTIALADAASAEPESTAASGLSFSYNANAIQMRTASSEFLSSLLGDLVETTPLILSENNIDKLAQPIRLQNGNGDVDVTNPEDPGGSPLEDPLGYRGRGAIDN